MQDPHFRLAAIDVDGTLVGPDLTVSQRNIHALQGLRQAGIKILLASGRSHANILPFYDQLSLEGTVVSVHGAVVRDSRTGEYLMEQGLSPEATRLITEEGRRLGVSILHYRRKGVFIETRTALTEYEQSRNFEAQTLVADLLSDSESPVHKLVWLAPRRRIDELAATMSRQFRGVATVTHTDPEYLEFTAPEANKAVGVAAAAERMGIQPDQIVAFGDGNNDIPMLAWAGVGVAMGHASVGAKTAADHIGPEVPVEVALAHAIDKITALQRAATQATS